MPKKIKKAAERASGSVTSDVSPILTRDEEKSAVSVGLVLGIAYLVGGAFVSIVPDFASRLVHIVFLGLIPVNQNAPDTSNLVLGLITVVMVGVIGGFFYAKVYNIIKKA